VQAASTVALLLLHCVKFAIANCKNQFTASNHLLGLIIIRSVSFLILGKQDPDTHMFDGPFFRDYPGEPVPETYNQSGFFCSRRR